MSDETPLNRLRDLHAFSDIVEQLTQCSTGLRAVVVNALRDRSIPTYLATEISMLQVQVQQQLSHARVILRAWPEA